MRKVLFWLMLLIVLFLVIVIGVATKEKTSPKAVLQGRFGKDTNTVMTGSITDNFLPTNLTGTMTGNLDGSMTGSLSDQDKEDTQNFLDSLVQQP